MHALEATSGERETVFALRGTPPKGYRSAPPEAGPEIRTRVRDSLGEREDQNASAPWEAKAAAYIHFALEKSSSDAPMPRDEVVERQRCCKSMNPTRTFPPLWHRLAG
jgi:hypothetical protein